MKISFNRNLAIFLISLALVAVTRLLAPALAAEKEPAIANNKYYRLYDKNKDFETECEPTAPRTSMVEKLSDPIDRTVEKYHEVMNCYFNRRIEKLTELKPEEFFEKITPPPFNNEKVRQPCQSDALSTYCLADIATKENFEFWEALSAIRKVEQERALFDFKQAGVNPQDAAAAAKRNNFGAIATLFQAQSNQQEYGETLEKIDLELEVSQKTLDQALAAYNEFQTALPMHRKYREVIDSLEEYRDKVADIRNEVHLFPTTFLDVTTPSCT